MKIYYYFSIIPVQYTISLFIGCIGSWVVFHLIRMQKCAYTSVEHVSCVWLRDYRQPEKQRIWRAKQQHLSIAHMSCCRLPIRWRGNEHQCICMMCILFFLLPNSIRTARQQGQQCAAVERRANEFRNEWNIEFPIKLYLQFSYFQRKQSNKLFWTQLSYTDGTAHGDGRLSMVSL